MPQHSAGILLFDDSSGNLRVFIAHMGGPLWARKDNGAWSIPKGLYDPADEHPADAARREFMEEVGVQVPKGILIDLAEVRQRSGKLIRGYALRAESSFGYVGSNTFAMEWPPRSGRIGEFPEIDRAEWFSVADARSKLVPGQVPFLDALSSLLGTRKADETTGAS